MPLITLPYKPRSQFQDYHDSTKRFAVSVCHRRAGKTVARINRLIKAAMCIDRSYPPGRFAYVAPYRNQAKKIAWLYAKHYSGPLGPKINEADLTLTMPYTGATIELYGADNAEAMRGNYFDGICADEAQGISRSALTQILLPCLGDYEGWLDCSGTPRGWTNLLGELVKLAKQDPEEWYLHILRASESGILPASELLRQKRLMSPNEYEQEYECSFDAAITGAVYGEQIVQADKAGRLMPGLPVANVPVHTAWDLGYDDATAIWWFQVLQGEIRLLNYYENNGEDIPHYCAVVSDYAIATSCRYGTHYVPHDAANELLAAGGRSIVQQAYGLGVKMVVVPATSQQNGIEAARKTLERCWFDTGTCAEGIEALRQYQFEFDADKKVFRSKPRHDFASHAADAFEIIGQVWQNPSDPAQKPKPRFLQDMTADELFFPARQQKRIDRI